MQSHASLLSCSSDLTQASGYKFLFLFATTGQINFSEIFSFDYTEVYIKFTAARVWWCFVVFQRDPAFWTWDRSRSLHVRVLLFSRCVTTVVTVWFISLVTLYAWMLSAIAQIVAQYCCQDAWIHVLNLIKTFLFLILYNVISYLSILKVVYGYKHFDKTHHSWV